ncbi:MAG TPA: OsmC family protein [Vicinamibacterales bacterium]|nr:OsmC family protein [Vicinamibacterales bacterium]
MPGPPTTAELVWTRDLQFEARSGQTSLTIDSRGVAGPSPIDALAFALAGCMAVDVVDILTKGRHALGALSAELAAERAPEPPRRFLTVQLHFRVTGDVPEAAVERAIQLSRDRYCSVWHTLRQDIAFTTTFEVRR